MIIRHAKYNEIDCIDEIYENERHFMHRHGNPNQWVNGYPSKIDIENDIKLDKLYVLDHEGSIEGVFFLSDGIDPTYNYIENGQWLNEEEYVVIHRIASAMKRRRIGDIIIQDCQKRFDNIRIDTHYDNKPMQNMLMRNGFHHVGTIYLEDGNPRSAYHGCRHCNIGEN